MDAESKEIDLELKESCGIMFWFLYGHKAFPLLSVVILIRRTKSSRWWVKSVLEVNDFRLSSALFLRKVVWLKLVNPCTEPHKTPYFGISSFFVLLQWWVIFALFQWTVPGSCGPTCGSVAWAPWPLGTQLCKGMVFPYGGRKSDQNISKRKICSDNFRNWFNSWKNQPWEQESMT